MTSSSPPLTIDAPPILGAFTLPLMLAASAHMRRRPDSRLHWARAVHTTVDVELEIDI